MDKYGNNLKLVNKLKTKPLSLIIILIKFGIHVASEKRKSPVALLGQGHVQI